MHNEVNGHHSIDEDPSHRKPSVKNTDRGKESEEKSDHKVHKIYSFGKKNLAPRLFLSSLLGKVLGEGTFSVVKLCTHRITGEKVAIKILEKSRIKNHEDFERMVREIRILRKIKHPNLIQLYEVSGLKFARIWCFRFFRKIRIFSNFLLFSLFSTFFSLLNFCLTVEI